MGGYNGGYNGGGNTKTSFCLFLCFNFFKKLSDCLRRGFEGPCCVPLPSTVFFVLVYAIKEGLDGDGFCSFSGFKNVQMFLSFKSLKNGL